MKQAFIFIFLMLMALVGAAMTPEARRSFEVFESCAENGDAEAQYRLSALLERGFDTVSADSARSLSLLRRSALSGYPPALNYLGYLFRSGYKVGRDTLLRANPDSLLHYVRLAADRGDPKAASNFAFILLHPSRSGRSSAAMPDSVSPSVQDSVTAVSYLRKAADAGLPQAMTMLADLYAEGKKDSLEAVSLYERAVGRRFHDAEIKLLNYIGPSLRRLDSASSLSEALRYWRMGAYSIAVELLHNIGESSPQAPRAFSLLGHAYSHGLGVPYNHAEANRNFARAALLGDPAAAFIIAETLEIFPDALTAPPAAGEITLPDPSALRARAAEAGITTAESAVAALFSTP